MHMQAEAKAREATTQSWLGCAQSIINQCLGKQHSYQIQKYSINGHQCQGSEEMYIHSLRMGLFQIVSMIVTVPLADPLVKLICFAVGSCQTSSTYICNQATICNR